MAPSPRARELAERFERTVAAFARVLDELTEEEWRLVCPDEQRTVGVLARHVAFAIPFQLAVFREIAAGRQRATIGWAELAAMNARHAEEWADCARDEVLALLQEYGALAAEEVRAFSDAQLARAGTYVTEVTRPWTLDRWIERVLIGHVSGHQASIEAALAAAHR